MFDDIGCVRCHTKKLGDVDGLYSDLCLHVIESDVSTLNVYYGDRHLFTSLPSDHPTPGQWKTPPLWGVADSAPYFHDGGAKTLNDAIVRHEVEANKEGRAYERLSNNDREALLAFLATLRSPRSADHVPALASRRNSTNSPKLPSLQEQIEFEQRIDHFAKIEAKVVKQENLAREAAKKKKKRGPFVGYSKEEKPAGPPSSMTGRKGDAAH